MNGNGLELVCRPGLPVVPAEFLLHGRLPRETYDVIPALSNSLMKRWLEFEATPSRFEWWLRERWNEPPTPAMALGSALDALLLEPKVFAERFVVLPEKGPRGGEGPARVTAKHREEHPGKVVITTEQCNAAAAMALALERSKATRYGELFKHCGKAVAVAELFAGVPYKGEIDLWDEGRTGNLVDVKSARDVSPAGFARQAAELGYPFQATIYLMLARALGFDKRVFSFVTVLNVEPWTVKAYRFAPYENAEHHATFHGIQGRLESATRSLLAAFKNGFRDDPRWEDLELPGWYLPSLRKVPAFLEEGEA